VPVDWHLAVRSLVIPTNVRTSEIFRRGMILEDAQTSMAEQALGMGAQYILFIEDDTAPPPGVIGELGRVLDTSDDSVMACGGIYTTRCDPPEPIVYMGPGQGAHWKWKLGDIFPCHAVGFGCVMLKTEIFKLMPKPWFKELKTIEEVREYQELFEVEDDQRRGGVSTDMFFYAKLAHMGFKVLAHGGVLPVHWDVEKQVGYWLPKGSYPVEGVCFNGQEYGWQRGVAV
jgi:hypothetical protein